MTCLLLQVDVEGLRQQVEARQRESEERQREEENFMRLAATQDRAALLIQHRENKVITSTTENIGTAIFILLIIPFFSNDFVSSGGGGEAE